MEKSLEKWKFIIRGVPLEGGDPDQIPVVSRKLCGRIINHDHTLQGIAATLHLGQVLDPLPFVRAIVLRQGTSLPSPEELQGIPGA